MLILRVLRQSIQFYVALGTKSLVLDGIGFPLDLLQLKRNFLAVHVHGDGTSECKNCVIPSRWIFFSNSLSVDWYQKKILLLSHLSYTILHFFGEKFF